MKHSICKAEINQDIYEKNELQVFGACSNQGCTRSAKWESMGPLRLKLCRAHVYIGFTHAKLKQRKFIKGMHDEGLITKHTKGWTYVIRMANGNVKIGTSVNLSTRLKEVSRDHNDGIPVAVLAVLPGGVSREALEHGRWHIYRMAGTEEQFHPAPELLEWAEQQGINEGAVEEVENFRNWKPQKDSAPYWKRWAVMMTEQKEEREREKKEQEEGEEPEKVEAEEVPFIWEHRDNHPHWNSMKDKLGQAEAETTNNNDGFGDW